MSNVGTAGAGCVTWGTASEAWGVMADVVEDWDGPTKMAVKAVGEAAGLAISVVDDDEAVSGRPGWDVSGRVLSASEI